MLLTLRFFPARPLGHNPPQSANRGRAAAGDGFQIENLIERLEESMIAAVNVKTDRSERSQEVIENKGKCFSHDDRSQEVHETKGVIRSKPRGCC